MKTSKVKSSISGDNIKAENGNWKFSGEMVDNFEQHVLKSVPIYTEGQELIKNLSEYFIKNDSVIYDIGCSTGKLLIDLVNRSEHKKNTKFIGIDIEEDMIKFAKSKQKKASIIKTKLDFFKEDVVNYKFESSDLIICYFTVQFIHPKHRQKLIDKIFKSLNWGGALLLFEKVRYNDARFQDMITTLYNDYKLEMGYSHEEILNKTRSLKGILEPFSSNANIKMLQRAGFKDICTVMKKLCFEGFLAIK
jgi:tRNA (cmo5U34)-methyltransferase